VDSLEPSIAASNGATERLKPLHAALSRVADAALVVAGTALVCMALVEAWQVFARYVLNDSPSWTEPVALFLMSTTMMLGAAVGVRSNRHFGFFVLVESVPLRLATALRLISNVVALAIGVMLALWSAQMLADSWDYPIAGAPLPQGIVFLPMCVGGALMALFSLERMLSAPPSAPPVE
jgi:TRAP-type C4-dicarboxylate transport system permease small subunit